MNETFSIKGIILKRDDYQEVDSQILVYSLEKGLMNLIARGSKKLKSKLAAHVEPISLVEIMVIRGKNKNYVGSAMAVDCFRNIKANYEKIMISGEVLRWIGEVVKNHEVDEDVFCLIFDFLNNLNSFDLEVKNDGLLVNFFILKFMTLLGYQPVLESCLTCGENSFLEKIFFNSKKGGLICERCYKKYTEEQSDSRVISVVTISTMKNVLENNFMTIFGYVLEEKKRIEFISVINLFEKYYLK